MRLNTLLGMNASLNLSDLLLRHLMTTKTLLLLLMLLLLLLLLMLLYHQLSMLQV